MVTQKASKAPRGNSLRGRSPSARYTEERERTAAIPSPHSLNGRGLFQPFDLFTKCCTADLVTHRSMTTGSEGVSLRLPQDFFSQHRLKVKQRQRENEIRINHGMREGGSGREGKHCDSERVLHFPPSLVSARPLISLAADHPQVGWTRLGVGWIPLTLIRLHDF